MVKQPPTPLVSTIDWNRFTMRSGFLIFIFSVTAIAVTGVSQEKPVDFAKESYPLL